MRWGPWIAYEAQQATQLKGKQLTNPHDGVIWKNGALAVLVEPEDFAGYLPVLHLSWRHDDRSPIHDWRVAQRMKSELCGANCEGLELYPNEERLIDGANQYHMYVFPPNVVLPLGINGQRAIADNDDLRRMYDLPEGQPFPGKQRDWATPAEKEAGRHDKGVFQELRVFPDWQDFTLKEESDDRRNRD